jgi:hypothetical protein
LAIRRERMVGSRKEGKRDGIEREREKASKKERVKAEEKEKSDITRSRREENKAK